MRFRVFDGDGYRDCTLREMMQAAMGPPNPDHIAYLKKEVKKYEETHNMTSEEMKSKVESNEIQETDAICSWLMLLRRLENMER